MVCQEMDIVQGEIDTVNQKKREIEGVKLKKILEKLGPNANFLGSVEGSSSMGTLGGGGGVGGGGGARGPYRKSKDRDRIQKSCERTWKPLRADKRSSSVHS